MYISVKRYSIHNLLNWLIFHIIFGARQVGLSYANKKLAKSARSKNCYKLRHIFEAIAAKFYGALEECLPHLFTISWAANADSIKPQRKLLLRAFI